MAEDYTKRVKDYIKKPRKFKFNPDAHWLTPKQRQNLKKLILPNGKIFLMPYDQAIEHSTYDNLVNPESIHAEYEIRLAIEGKMSGVVLHPGAAEKFWLPVKNKIPLVLKIDGKCDIPPQDKAISTPMGSIERAVELGASAIGTTLYWGSELQYQIHERLTQIIEGAKKAGLPVIVWAYPRGAYVDKKGGPECIGNIAGAVKFAQDIGAAIIKANYPQGFDPGKKEQYHKNYQNLQLNAEEGMQWIVKGCAGPSGIIMSGGGVKEEADLLKQAEGMMKAEGDGFVVGRNLFLRPFSDGVKLLKKYMGVLNKHSTTGDVVKY